MEGDSDHIELARLTRQSAADMFRSIMNPEENTGWIKPENMRRTLANLIYVNNDNISREAHEIAEKLSIEKVDGIKYSEIEAAFLIQAGLNEFKQNGDKGIFTSDEIDDAIKALNENEVAWQKIINADLGEDAARALQEKVEYLAGVSIANKARLAKSRAFSVSTHARTVVASVRERLTQLNRKFAGQKTQRLHHPYLSCLVLMSTLASL